MKSSDTQPSPLSPRPLGFLELSSGLALDRGPAFSPAQLSVGRKRLDDQSRATPSGSQESLPFAEEDASLVESPDWDQSTSLALTFTKRDSNPRCELASSIRDENKSPNPMERPFLRHASQLKH